MDRLNETESVLRLESSGVGSIKNARTAPCVGEDEKSLKTALIESAKEAYEERAAIIEFDAGLSRAKAESMALREVSQRYGADVAKGVRK